MGSELRVVVTASNATGSAAAASDTATVVALEPPIVISEPSITGTMQVGQILIGEGDTWQKAEYTGMIQWYRRASGSGLWKPISDATIGSTSLGRRTSARTCACGPWR